MKLKLSLKMLAVVTAGILVFNSCKKEGTVNSGDRETKVARKQQRLLSAEEKALKQKLRHVSYLFAEALKDQSFRKDFNQEIAAKLKATTNDESLSFAELSGREDKKLNQISNSTEEYRINAAFAKSFLERINKVHASGKYHKAEEFSSSKKGTMVKDAFIEDGSGGTVYYPYSENFNLDPALTNYTITSHPIDNSDENEGIVWNSSTGNWDYVLVDDAYAYTHPTYIITVDDGPTSAEIASSTLNGIGCDYIPLLQGSFTPPANTSSFSLVYWGKFRLERQAEGLFDGPSEIVLVRPSTSPQLDANGEFKTVDMGVGSLVSLQPIKRRKVKEMLENKTESITVGSTFMSDWKPAYQEVPMVIYEYDKGQNTSVELPLKVKLLNGAIEVGGKFAVNIASRKQPYVVEPIDRNVYFALKNTPHPLINPPLIDNWRVWGIQSSHVTLVQDGQWNTNYSY